MILKCIRGVIFQAKWGNNQMHALVCHWSYLLFTPSLCTILTTQPSFNQSPSFPLYPPYPTLSLLFLSPFPYPSLPSFLHPPSFPFLSFPFHFPIPSLPSFLLFTFSFLLPTLPSKCKHPYVHKPYHPTLPYPTTSTSTRPTHPFLPSLSFPDYIAALPPSFSSSSSYPFPAPSIHPYHFFLFSWKSHMMGLEGVDVGVGWL